MRISDWSSDVCSSDLITRFVGDKPVDKSIAPIFGQVDESAIGIYRHGFVVKPAHGFQRHWLGKHGGGRCGHFKYVPVILLVAPRFLAFKRFLAGKPAVPRGWSARAVAAGSRQREVLVFDFLRLFFKHECGVAT